MCLLFNQSMTMVLIFPTMVFLLNQVKNSAAKPRKKKPKSKAEIIEKESSDSDNSAKVKSSAREESTMDSFPETFRKKKVKTEPKEHTEVDHKVKSKPAEKQKKEKKKKVCCKSIRF